MILISQYFIIYYILYIIREDMVFVGFICYLIVFVVGTLLLGLNDVRIQIKTGLNPKIFILLLPLLINVTCYLFQFIAAHTVFHSVNPLLTTLFPCLFCYFVVRKLQNVRIFALFSSNTKERNTLLSMIRKNLMNMQIIDC